ncbi:MAG: L-seryl-tRNA(Sec) selenium transferase [Nitrospiraceae bacterium]|nr:L-seryl-tRNA(Sec) selenium transferase [Nitrospiraceae bacterium]
MSKKSILSSLPSVDEILKSVKGIHWLKSFPRKKVLQAIREIIDETRQAILDGLHSEVPEHFESHIEERIKKLSDFSLKRVINATGVVIHTNLGRSVLSEEVLERAAEIASGYSNLEYDLDTGKRGKRYSHVQSLLNEITGAESSLIVNNNAAAVLVCLSALSKGKEVIVSRGELVEIGGAFRVPDVMAHSGCTLKEVGTTNKTHLYDYENAINENTALLMQVHQSNFRMIGFTEAVSTAELVSLGKERSIPVMYDLGSGCLIDMKPAGINNELTVQEVVAAGADIVTFSGDKLLGGPQAGIIAGKKKLIDIIAKNPLMRAVRIDKLTLAAFEATLMYYLDENVAKKKVETLRMLFQQPQEIRARAERIMSGIQAAAPAAAISVIEDESQSGGGALPEVGFATFVVSIKPENASASQLEAAMRRHNPPVICRIKDNALLLDARTIRDEETSEVINAAAAALALK